MTLKKSPETFGLKKRLFENLYRENFFAPPQTRSQVSAYDVMTIEIQIVQTPSPVFFKSLRRCSRELGPVGYLVNLGFSYRGVFIGEKVIGDLGNRGLGPVGELGLDYNRGFGLVGELGNRGLGQSGTWAYRGVGIGFTIGDLGLSGSWVYRGFCYRGVFIGEKVIEDLGYRANVVLPFKYRPSDSCLLQYDSRTTPSRHLYVMEV